MQKLPRTEALGANCIGNKGLVHTTKGNKYSTVCLFHSQIPTFYFLKDYSGMRLSFVLTYYTVISYDSASFVKQPW